MGIIRLGQFLKKSFPQVMRPRPPQSYKQKVLAVDASSTIYSFLAKTITYSKNRVNMPTDSSGNLTGHLIGMLYRVLLCKELSIRTVWVFDGKPPRQKADELYRRRQIKEEAAERADTARQEGDIEQAVKQSKRMIFVSKQQRQDAKKLIRLMGIPVVQAKSEAQAQCAWLNKNKIVDGVIGEDIDTLVFGGNILVKKFARDDIATQVNREEILDALDLTQEQFIDFCILCGCDYTAKIPGIGPVKALQMIKNCKTIEGVIGMIQEDDKLRAKHMVPDDFNHLIARRLFIRPEVVDITQSNLIQGEFQQNQLRTFLLEREFGEIRIKNWIQKVKQFDHKNSL